MVETKKAPYTKSDLLSREGFAQKYGINIKLVSEAVVSLYKKHIHAKNTQGQLRPVIFPSPYKIHPLFHDIVLAEIDKIKGRKK